MIDARRAIALTASDEMNDLDAIPFVHRRFIPSCAADHLPVYLYRDTLRGQPKLFQQVGQLIIAAHFASFAIQTDVKRLHTSILRPRKANFKYEI